MLKSFNATKIINILKDLRDKRLEDQIARKHGKDKGDFSTLKFVKIWIAAISRKIILKFSLSLKSVPAKLERTILLFVRNFC